MYSSAKRVSDQTQSSPRKRPAVDLIPPEVDDDSRKPPLEASTLSGEKTIMHNELGEKVIPTQHLWATKDKATDHSSSSAQSLAKKLLLNPQLFAHADSDMLSYCAVCNKDTNHLPYKCPEGEKVRRRSAYCTFCNVKTDHFTFECPNATEDALKKLQYCMLCSKNTDHSSFDCPNKEGFLWCKGVYVPYICDLCHKTGDHLAADCPLDEDKDLYFDPPDEEW